MLLSSARICLDYLLCYHREFAGYFHEEIESGLTIVIYFLNDNLLVRSLSVIAKSPACWWSSIPTGSVDEMDKINAIWRDVGVALLRCTQCACHAISFLFVGSGVSLLRCVNDRRG